MQIPRLQGTSKGNAAFGLQQTSTNEGAPHVSATDLSRIFGQ